MEGDPESESTFFSAHMNLCLCYLKSEKYSEAKHSANVALKLRPDDEKAHFRAGKVYFALGEYFSALNEFKECLRINPNNKAAKTEITLSSNALKEHTKQERKIYGQMFDRFAEEDTQVIDKSVCLNSLFNWFEFIILFHHNSSTCTKYHFNVYHYLFEQALC